MRFKPLAFCFALAACAPEMSSPVSVDEDGDAATGVDARNLGTSARVYRFSTNLARCGAWSLDEDFSSGRYNAHRFVFTAHANATVELQLARQRGTWQPSIIIAPAPGVTVTEHLSGRTGAVA